ncbi:hypothetical protein [Archaeoglobus neptunius]|uniref:hypothetical protein n=1 Tax=Archaeoglobus neptunius TaxID=2798580 RepID=UPI0019267215|nr:hypothetical protein [Archaeoglobus neptunius]
MKVKTRAFAEQNMYLVTMHLPSERRISKSLPKYIDEYLAGGEEIRLVRGYFLNKLHRLNEKARTAATKYGVRVDPSWYLMSESGLKKFLRDIDRVREEYDTYEQMLNDFLIHGKLPKIDNERVKLYPEYTERVKEYLAERETEVKPIKIVEGITVNILPLRIDESTIARVADEKLKAEIRKTAEEIRKKVEKDVEERLENLAKKFKNFKRISNLPSVRKAVAEEVENVKTICSEYGIDIPKDMEYKMDAMLERFYGKVTDQMSNARARALVKKLTAR